MRCSDLMAQLEKLAPRSLACDWDNPGFQAGRQEKDIKRILVALDLTDEVVDQAVSEHVDLVLTHHPVIFKPLKLVNDQNFISRRILTLIQADICYYAMHTNFDVAPGCMADLAAERLGMKSEEPLEVTGEVDGALIGIGKVGTLPEAMTLEELAHLVKKRFDLPFVTVYGMDTITEPISRIAISPGAGGSMIGFGVEKHAQVIITGDIGHHSGIDAVAEHMAVIDAGHYGLEHIFMPFMKEYLGRMFGGELEVMTARPAFPARVL